MKVIEIPLLNLLLNMTLQTYLTKDNSSLLSQHIKYTSSIMLFRNVSIFLCIHEDESTQHSYYGVLFIYTHIYSSKYRHLMLSNSIKINLSPMIPYANTQYTCIYVTCITYNIHIIYVPYLNISTHVTYPHITFVCI